MSGPDDDGPAPEEGPARIPLNEFVEVGYLQEANRRFFHPLGLALEVSVATEPTALLLLRGEDVGRLRELADKLRALEPAQGAAMDALDRLLDGATQLQPGDGYVSGVWDARGDPEGIVFADGLVDPEKAARIRDELALRAIAREATLGYVLQPANP